MPKYKNVLSIILSSDFVKSITLHDLFERKTLWLHVLQLIHSNPKRQSNNYTDLLPFKLLDTTVILKMKILIYQYSQNYEYS